MKRRAVVGDGLICELVRQGGENALVEHLAALLRIPSLAELFIAHVVGGDVSPAGYQVKTQVVDPITRARPDVVMSCATRTLWIEAKLDADFTEKQPVIYIEALRALDEGHGHLVMLIKSSRWLKTAHQLRERVGLPPGVERCFHHQEVPVTLVTWREVRDCFYGHQLKDPVAAYLLTEFVTNIDQYVEMPIVPFQLEMITVLNDPHVLNAMVALEDVLSVLRERLKANGFKTKEERGDLGHTGFNVWPVDDEEQVYGVWVGLLLRAGIAWPGKGPVWLCLWGEAYEDEALLKADVEKMHVVNEINPFWTGYVISPLTLAGRSTEEAVEGLLTQMNRVFGCVR